MNHQLSWLRSAGLGDTGTTGWFRTGFPVDHHHPRTNQPTELLNAVFFVLEKTLRIDMQYTFLLHLAPLYS